MCIDEMRVGRKRRLKRDCNADETSAEWSTANRSKNTTLTIQTIGARTPQTGPRSRPPTSWLYTVWKLKAAPRMRLMSTQYSPSRCLTRVSSM